MPESLYVLPPPWHCVATLAVGGLNAVGFSKDSQHLLVESVSGLGLFDVASGQRLARNYDALHGETPTRSGIGPIEGELVHMAGLWGGQLDHRTTDGWSSLEHPPDRVELISPTGERSWLSDEVMDFRVSGFSQDGRAFVLGTSADVTVFARASLSVR